MGRTHPFSKNLRTLAFAEAATEGLFYVTDRFRTVQNCLMDERLCKTIRDSFGQSIM